MCVKATFDVCNNPFHDRKMKNNGNATINYYLDDD